MSYSKFIDHKYFIASTLLCSWFSHWHVYMNINTSHAWSWWWVKEYYFIDIVMITSYPSSRFKRTFKFTLLSSFKLINYQSCRISKDYRVNSPIIAKLCHNLNRVRSSTHMAPNFREIRTLTSSSEISWLKGNQTG